MTEYMYVITETEWECGGYNPYSVVIGCITSEEDVLIFTKDLGLSIEEINESLSGKYSTLTVHSSSESSLYIRRVPVIYPK